MKKVLIIISAIILAIFLSFYIPYLNRYKKYQNAIDDVANKTSIKPSSVECRNVELADVCYAYYQGLDQEKAKQMLINSGYELVDQNDSINIALKKISATNKKAGIRVDSEVPPPKDTIVLKFKNINVYL